MRNSIRQELLTHIITTIEEQDLTDFEDLHYLCFNEDYYIIYHNRAIEWLKEHNIDTFEAIEIVQDYENDTFGETNTKINPESIVNMYVYILGEELLSEINLDQTQEEVLNDLKDILS